MYKIGEVSRYCSLPVKTLRYWADIGLLVPDEIDRFTGYRYYSASKLAECSRIIALKELGFSLDEVRAYRDGSEEELAELIDRKKRELAELIASGTAKLARLNTLRSSIASGNGKMYDIILKKPDRFPAAVKRGIFETRGEAALGLERLRKALPERVMGARAVIVNYETEYRERGFDLMIGVELTAGAAVPLPEGFVLRELGGEAETASVVAPESELDEAYHALILSLDERSLQAVGPFCELYHSGGGEKYVELQVPVCRLGEDRELTPDEAPEPFENDPEAVGMWAFQDLLRCEEQFDPNDRKYGDWENIWLDKLCFLEGGGGYWIVGGWTKGMLYMANHEFRFANSYHIEERGGERYMFIRMKDYRLERRGGAPLIYVYRKLDSLPRTADELGKHDELPTGFEPDERVVGEWTACDFVADISGFDPENPRRREQLFWQKAEFLPDGRFIRGFSDGRSFAADYTRGVIRNERKRLAEAYRLETIGGAEYLFCQWKSGDYVWGGREPCWYVFRRSVID